MKEYPKEPCKICGAVISTHHIAQSQHAKKHKMDADKKPEEVKAPEQAPVTEPVAVPTEKVARRKQAEFANPEEKKLYERALAVQAEMLKSPEAFVSEDSSDQFNNLRKIYAPETIDQYDPRGRLIKRADRSCYFGLPDAMEQDVARGYVPVVNEHGMTVRGPGNMPMYTIARAISDAREHSAQNESRARLASSLDVGKVREARSTQAMPTEEDKKFAKYTDEKFTRQAMGE